jgi:hypothetical protein
VAILTYQLDVIGEAKVAAALASVERRFVQHQARINRVLNMGGGQMRVRPGGASTAAVRSELRATTAAQDKTVKLTRENLKAIREVGREQRASQHLERAQHREKLRGIERIKRAEIAAVRAAIRERVTAEKRARASVRQAFGTGVTRGVGALQSVGTAGAAMLGVGGSVLAASAVQDTLRLDEQVRRLVVAGRGAGQAGLDPEALRRQIVNTGMGTGLAPEQVASGLQTFVGRTGDLDLAVKNMEVFATVAQATGASMDDVAGSAADLMQKFDITTVEGMADAFGVLVAQGKKGAFELRDMAANFPEMAAAAQRAGMKGLQGMRTLGGLAQLARTSTGSGAEASTAVQMMLTQLVADSDKLGSGEALGGRKVNIFTGKTKSGAPDATTPLRAVPEVLADVIAASRGNLQQLQDVFDVRGIRAVSPMVSRFREASAAAGGGKAGEQAGRAAVLAMITEASEVAGNYAEVQRDATDVQKATSVQLEVAMLELKDVLASELVPIVRDVTPQIRDLGPPLREVTQSAIALGQVLADNPLLGLGAIIGAAIAVEIGKAQLASVLQGGIVSPLGAVGMAAGVAAAAMFAFEAYLQKKENEGRQKAAAAAARGDEVRKAAKAELDATGRISPETEKKLNELRAVEDKTLAAGGHSLKSSHTAIGMVGTGLLTAGAMLGSDADTAELERRKAVQGAATSPEYMAGAAETKRLLQANELSKKYGAEDFKAAEVGKVIGDAAVAQIQKTPLNRSDAPSKPTK